VDLVVEQQQAELVADRAQVLEELRGRRTDAPSPWIGSTRMPAVSSSTMSRTTLVLLSGACL